MRRARPLVWLLSVCAPSGRLAPTARAAWHRLLLSSIAVVALSLAAPVRALGADLVGTWEWKGDALAITLQLDAGGAGRLDANAITWSQGNATGYSDHETGTLTIVSDGEKIAYTYSVTAAGDRLTLSGGDLDQPTTFTRKSAHGIGARKTGTAPVAPPAPLNPPLTLGEPPAAPAQPPPFPPPPTPPTPPQPTQGAPGASVAGNWQMQAPNGVVVHMELNPDSTGGLQGQPLHWKLDGQTLSLQLAAGTVMYGCSLANDQLTLSGGDLAQPATFRRAAPRPPPDPAMLRRLVGTWRGPDGVDSEVRADGTLVQQGQTMKFAATADTLTITGANGPVEAPYRLDGDTLTITANGQAQTFRRVGAASAQPPPGQQPVPGQTPAPPQQAGTDGAPAALCGVWVCEEASVDPTIVMTYTQYVTLFPDGSVGYSKSEGGASRTRVSDSIERFRSWHDRPPAQADVYGRWTSDGRAITVRWNRWNGLVSQGEVDGARGAMTLSGMGVLAEGQTMTFKKQ